MIVFTNFFFLSFSPKLRKGKGKEGVANAKFGFYYPIASVIFTLPMPNFSMVLSFL